MPPMRIEFSIPGVVGKGRPRFYRGHAVTPEATRAYELLIAKSFCEAMFHAYAPGAWLMEGAYTIHIAAHYPVPKSWSKKKKLLAYSGALVPGKPDLDNVIKAVLDGLNGVCFRDDKQVERIEAEKHYSAREDGHVDIVVEAEA